MAKKKLKNTEGKVSIGAISESLKKSIPGFVTAADLTKRYKYIDFCDPKTGRPALAMIWLFGSRGMVRGRVTNLVARGSCGKSSFMYYVYACAQKMESGAWVAHAETEGAPAPADFIASYGVDTEELMVENPRSFDAMSEWIDTLEAAIRGPWSDSQVNPATGRRVKSKFVDPVDPPDENGLCKAPLVIGVDSISVLGSDAETMVDVIDTSKDRRLGGLAKPARDYFNRRTKRFELRDSTIILASQETENINTNPMMRGRSSITCKAYNALFIMSTYMILMTSKKWTDKEPPYTQHGDIITMFTDKNKISPRYREISLYLRHNHGFDMVETDINWLMTHKSSPFVDPMLTPKYGNITRYGGRYTCKILRDKAFDSGDDFLDALYKNEEVVSSIMEDLRIRGYGFDFETKYNIEEYEDGVDGMDPYKDDCEEPD